MLLNIFPYYVISYLFTHCPEKIPLLPKVTTPQLGFNFWVLLKNFTTRNTLQDPDHLGDGVPRRKRYQNVNMIFRDLALIYLKIKMNCDLMEELLHPYSNIAHKNLCAVFRTPN